MSLRIYTLGQFAVRDGERVLIDRSWRRRKAAALLKLLAIQPSRSLHREQVMDALWPDLDPAAAANNLYKNLHYLRAALGGDTTARRQRNAGTGQRDGGRVLAANHVAHQTSGTNTPGAARGGLPPVAGLTGEVVVLSPLVWVDCHAFRSQADAARAIGDPAAYEAALALYAGDLLPDDRYEDWAEPARDALRALWLALLSEVAGLYEARGQTALAIERWQQVVDADPLHEPAHRALMRLFAQTGSRHRALRQLQQCREALQRELGVEPAEETAALYRDILAGAPLAGLPVDAAAGQAAGYSGASAAVTVRDPGAGEATPAERRPPVEPFYGREEELSLARRVLDAAGSGAGQALFVGGVAGIGKSRFAQEVLGAAQARGALCLVGRSYELEASASYQPVRDMLGQLLARHATSAASTLDASTQGLQDHAMTSPPGPLSTAWRGGGVAGGEVVPRSHPPGSVWKHLAAGHTPTAHSAGPTTASADTVTALAEAYEAVQGSVHVKRLLPSAGVDVLPAADPSLLQAELFDELASLFGQLATPAQPLVLLFDDLHWADAATLRLVHFLCRRLASQPVLLLATYRAEQPDQSPALAALLGSLRRDRLVREVALGPLADDAMRRVVAHRFGIQPVAPDLLDEITRYAGGNPLFATEIVHTAIEQGWARLEGGRWERHGEADAPVPGAVYDLLDQRLQRLPDAARHVLFLAAVAERDVDFGLLRATVPVDEGALLDALDSCIDAYLLEEAPEGYRYRHSLLRQGIYARLIRARRQQLHRTLAARLAQLERSDSEAAAIGYHFTQSDEPWHAVPFLRRAARRAAAVFANDEAIRLYEQALRLLRAHPERDPSGRLAGGAAGDEPPLLPSLLEELGDLVQRSGEAGRAATLFEDACGALAGDDAAVVRVRGKAALAHIAAGSVQRAADLLNATLHAIGEQSPAMVVARTYYILAQLHWHNAQYQDALAAAEKAFLAAESSGDAVQRAHAYEVLALACHALGDWQKGVECELSRHSLGVPGFDTDEAFDAHL